MKTSLTLRVKKEYFDQIKTGTKTEEYRVVNDYWTSRIVEEMDRVTTVRILLGYPKRGDMSKVLEFPYKGYTKKQITHPLFGPTPVLVYAVTLER